MSLQIYILLPNGIFYNENIDEIIIKTTMGQLGLLKGHIPLITIIEISPIIFRRESDWTVIVLMGGLAFILNNRITIIVNSAEMAYLIDKNKIKKSFKMATNRLNITLNEKTKVYVINVFLRERVRYETICYQNESISNIQIK